MARELSTKWWNVIRRKMYATHAKSDPRAKCPDCCGSMYLMEGRYGRYYRCQRLYQCEGTIGARLDGKVIPQKGPRKLLMARRQARLAVSGVVRAREALTQWKYEVEGRWYAWQCKWSPFGHSGTYGDVREDFRLIIEKTGLKSVAVPSKKNGRQFHVTAYWRLGLHIKRRSFEECERITQAAVAIQGELVDELENLKRRHRNNAWDRVYLGVIDEHLENATV